MKLIINATHELLDDFDDVYIEGYTEEWTEWIDTYILEGDWIDEDCCEGSFREYGGCVDCGLPCLK